MYRNVRGFSGGRQRFWQAPSGAAGRVKHITGTEAAAVGTFKHANEFQKAYARYAKLMKVNGHKPLPPKQWVGSGYPEPRAPKPTRAAKTQRAIDTSDRLRTAAHRQRTACAPVRTATNGAQSDVQWPIHVTIGPHPTLPGALEVVELTSREHADSLGFEWVGR